MADRDANEGTMDLNDLWREEVITDRKVGTIRVMTPITAGGMVDAKRAIQYIGQAQIMTPAGALPLSFEIPAKTLADAVVNFTAAAQKGIEQAMEELRQLQREQASQIVIPKGPLPGGGKMGGGGIQIP
jgi:hypothetical protein